MAAYLTLLESQVVSSVRQFLLELLPTGVEVIRTQVNRVPSPKVNFVAMTVLRRGQLSFTVASVTDVVFTGAIAGTTLTVSAVSLGSIRPPIPLRSPNILPNTRIVAFGTGSGGGGTYEVTPSQTMASAVIFGGSLALLQPTQLDMQLDFYGSNSGDMVQTIANCFQTEVGTASLITYEEPLRDGAGIPLEDGAGNQLTAGIRIDIAPLYAGVARNIPFITAESQYERRWSMDVSLQINPQVYLAQDFADQLQVTLVSVDTLS